MKKNALGFTLVELLIAVTILSVLATTGFIVYSGILPKTRDSKRISDLNKLAIALQLYYQKNGRYMDNTQGLEGSCTNAADTAAFYTEIKDYMVDLEVPKDPKIDTQTKSYPFYCYISVSDGQSYRLFAKLENCQDSKGNLCKEKDYNYSVYSNDLTLAPASL